MTHRKRNRVRPVIALLALTGLASAQAGAPRAEVWALELLPLAERFERAEEVSLVLTVRNVGDEPRAIALPQGPRAAWPQWVQVERDGERLEPAADHDFAAEPALLAPGEQLSVQVDLARFLSPAALADAGPGRYELRWDGGTIGLASSAEASVTLTGAPLLGPKPGTLESFLVPSFPGEPLAERVLTTWSRFESRPSDPRLVAFLAALPAGSFDPLDAFELLEATNDRGVQRELVRLLGRVGRDAYLAQRLIEFLTEARDPSLSGLGSEALESLRGE
jgi:hypothetical protein